MDTKSILNARKKLNELASQHNKLTTLVACLLNEINSVKRELNELKSGDIQNSALQYQNMPHMQSSNQILLTRLVCALTLRMSHLYLSVEL